jgi:hypothetical protein
MTPKKTDPKTAAGFFAREAADWKSLAGLWAGLPERDLIRPGACGEWSIKDVWNHIASWQAAAREVIPIRLSGGAPPKGVFTVGKFNPAQYARCRKLPLASSKRRLQRNRKLLLELLKRVPKRQLLEPKQRVGSWAKFCTYAHYEEHFRTLDRFRRMILKDAGEKKASGKASRR